MIIGPADGKGMGAFADEPLRAGQWVCAYRGELVTLLQTTQIYAQEEPEYLFMLTPDLYLDAMNSTHFSRYFNHAERGSLNFTVSTAEQRVDFYAARDITVGEELTFDYGVIRHELRISPPHPTPWTHARCAQLTTPPLVGAGYWAGSSQLLAAGTDSRNFTIRKSSALPPAGVHVK